MKAIISGFQFLIDTIKMVFSFVSFTIETIVMVFRYLITIVGLAFDVILTFPSWIQAFSIITIAISIAYFLIGRNTGKSD